MAFVNFVIATITRIYGELETVILILDVVSNAFTIPMAPTVRFASQGFTGMHSSRTARIACATF